MVASVIFLLVFVQMTDARCKRCNEKQVGLTEIIQAGHGDRYHVCTFSFLFFNVLNENVFTSLLAIEYASSCYNNLHRLMIFPAGVRRLW